MEKNNDNLRNSNGGNATPSTFFITIAFTCFIFFNVWFLLKRINKYWTKRKISVSVCACKYFHVVIDVCCKFLILFEKCEKNESAHSDTMISISSSQQHILYGLEYSCDWWHRNRMRLRIHFLFLLLYWFVSSLCSIECVCVCMCASVFDIGNCLLHFYRHIVKPVATHFFNLQQSQCSMAELNRLSI